MDYSVKGLTRRRLLGVAGLAGATLAAGCGAEPAGTSASAGSASMEPGGSATVRFSNWPGYIDVAEAGESSTLDDFTTGSGVPVAYSEDINDGSEYLAKVRPVLEQGGDIGADIVVLSEETAHTFIEDGFAQPLDYALIPNAANLLPRLREASFDPGRRYSLPWQSGFTGFGWNEALLRERLGVAQVSTFEQFFDPRLAGRVAVLSETMDTMGLMLAWQGFDPANFTDSQFDDALAVLRGYVDDGTIRQVTGNDYIGGLESGDLIACLGWSGDVLALGEGFGFGLPESGGLVWADSMLVPATSVHGAEAARLMNHYYDPVVAARLASWIQYVCPVEGAREAMADIDPGLVEDPWIFPSSQVLAEAYVTQSLSSARSQDLDRRFDAAVNV